MFLVILNNPMSKACQDLKSHSLSFITHSSTKQQQHRNPTKAKGRSFYSNRSRLKDPVSQFGTLDLITKFHQSSPKSEKNTTVNQDYRSALRHYELYNFNITLQIKLNRFYTEIKHENLWICVHLNIKKVDVFTGRRVILFVNKYKKQQ